MKRARGLSAGKLDAVQLLINEANSLLAVALTGTRRPAEGITSAKRLLMLALTIIAKETNQQ